MAKNIVDELNDIRKSYYQDKVSIFDGLSYSQYQTLKQIEFYTNSKYLTGGKDQLGRDKPFYNIVNAKVNLATTATDLDTKDIQVMSDTSTSFDKSFLLKREVHNWIKEVNFGMILNQIGETRSRYGGVIVKKVMRDGKLNLEIPEWKNVITDQVDFERGAKIEKHYMTPSEYAEKHSSFNLNVPLDDVLKMATNTRKLNMSSQTKTPTKYIIVWEIRGEFPETFIDGTGDKNKYTNQYHIVIGEVENKQIHVHAELEKESIYKFLPWRKVPGRALGVGVVEDGFEAQIWTNDAKMREKEIMEIASKIGFKTTDPKMQNNILTDLDNGFILKMSPGHDIQQVNTVSNAIPEFAKLVSSWDDQFSKVSSTFEANTGETLPSGTPFRLAAIQAQNANSLFTYRRQELGIFLKELFDDWIIPYLVKKMNTEHILAADFSHEELKSIDEAFAINLANEKFFDMILSDKEVTQETYDQMYNMSLDFIQTTKARRFLEIPKDYFKDVKTKVDIITTGEEMNKSVVLESLNNIMTTVAQNPQILENPILSQIFARIVEVTNVGLSPITMGIGLDRPKKPQQAPQPQPQPQGQQQQQPNQPQQNGKTQ